MRLVLAVSAFLIVSHAAGATDAVSQLGWQP